MNNLEQLAILTQQNTDLHTQLVTANNRIIELLRKCSEYEKTIDGQQKKMAAILKHIGDINVIASDIPKLAISAPQQQPQQQQPQKPAQGFANLFNGDMANVKIQRVIRKPKSAESLWNAMNSDMDDTKWYQKLRNLAPDHFILAERPYFNEKDNSDVIYCEFDITYLYYAAISMALEKLGVSKSKRDNYTQFLETMLIDGFDAGTLPNFNSAVSANQLKTILMNRLITENITGFRDCSQIGKAMFIKLFEMDMNEDRNNFGMVSFHRAIQPGHAFPDKLSYDPTVENSNDNRTYISRVLSGAKWSVIIKAAIEAAYDIGLATNIVPDIWSN
jgi:hypothetical protein